MYIDSWWFWAGGTLLSVTIACLVRVIFALRHQIACLRYCYMDMSDWAEERLSESRDFAISDLANGNEGDIWDGLVHYKEDWGKKVDYHTRLMQNKGLPTFAAEERTYVLDAATRGVGRRPIRG